MAIMQFPETTDFANAAMKEMVLEEKYYNDKKYTKLVWSGNWIEVKVKEIKITTMLLHESAQHVKSCITVIPEDNSHHSMGKAITYGRRYSLMSILGICPEDDDGNPTPKGDNKKQPKTDSQNQPQNTSNAPETPPPAPNYLLDSQGRKRFNPRANKFDDDIQKSNGLITTADWLVYHGLIIKNLSGNVEGFKSWVKVQYGVAFFNIKKEWHDDILDILSNNPEKIMGL
jgi:hypothetical protein